MQSVMGVSAAISAEHYESLLRGFVMLVELEERTGLNGAVLMKVGE